MTDSKKQKADAKADEAPKPQWDVSTHGPLPDDLHGQYEVSGTTIGEYRPDPVGGLVDPNGNPVDTDPSQT